MSLAAAPLLQSGQGPPRSQDKNMADDSSCGQSAPWPVDVTEETESGPQPEPQLESQPESQPNALSADGKKNIKSKKRSLFGFGKKRTDTLRSVPSSEHASLPRDGSRLSSMCRQATTPPTPNTTAAAATEACPFVLPSSPNRALSNSPRIPSPAGSQIFERDVQDSTVLKPSSPAIPTHIQTENYIPPVLDDASEAITNDKLDPDAVEIVTHTSHQPVSVTVAGAGAGAVGSEKPFEQSSSEWAAELASFADRVGLPPDNASNLGSLDSADVRRLSFISFADVVQGEHTGHAGSSLESMHLGGLTCMAPAAVNRSPSPMRSPVSTSPPTSSPGSVKGLDASPPRRPMGSPPTTGGGGQHSLAAPNDLNIETMRQALRRTGSADLSNVRSMPTSPVDAAGSR